MFARFFLTLRQAGLPVSLTEYLTLLDSLQQGVADYRVETFYYLSRAVLVKDERHFDRFDRVFSHVFEGAEFFVEDPRQPIPDEWLRKLAERFLSAEEMARVEALGGWEELMETLRKRLQEQKERHQGGSKWIGTAGTSPFGAYGYNPEGIRIGQDRSRHRSAVKVWDKREYKNLADDVELGTRTLKMALRRLRQFSREGAAEVLDLADTIRSTAKNAGHLDLKFVPEKHNAVKVLLFLDVGGSMDDHIEQVAGLFSAARAEFKHLEYYYFHNCLYESVWQDNARRWDRGVPTQEVLNTYSSDYKVFVVGDASMSPYEIVYPGGAVEHWNEEAGAVWLRRLQHQFSRVAWLNPVPADYWAYTQSIGMIQEIVGDRMYPLTLQGLDRAIHELMA